ncbi:MAG: HisA/HisF-related TIM barrel protein [Candidatus Sericytochromatia bacterium]
MLKKRIIANLVIKNDIVVQSINFSRYLPVGKPDIAVEFFNDWGVDEIIYNDISATLNNKEPNYDLIREVSRKCYVPLTVGGGISNISQIKKLMHCGADKVALNSSLSNSRFVLEASRTFGNQCLVASIDSIYISNDYYLYNYLTHKAEDIKIIDFIKYVQEIGVGEILINSIERDGTYLDFNEELIKIVCLNSNVPVICIGGAKNTQSFINILENSNVSGVAASNILHFTEHSITQIKSQLIKNNILLRHDTDFTYNNSLFDKNFRLLKKDDKILEELLFKKFKKEII